MTGDMVTTHTANACVFSLDLRSWWRLVAQANEANKRWLAAHGPEGES